MATLPLARSFFSTISRKDGTYVAGVRRVLDSSRFQTSQMAKDRGSYYDRAVYDVEVAPSMQPPEIFIHCGKEATSVGGRCGGCGRKMTAKDALASSSVYGSIDDLVDAGNVDWGQVSGGELVIDLGASFIVVRDSLKRLICWDSRTSAKAQTWLAKRAVKVEAIKPLEAL